MSAVRDDDRRSPGTERLRNRWRDLFYSAELRSEHPLGEAVVRYLEGLGATACPLSGFESLTGKGIRFREPEGIPAAGENPVFGPDTIPDGRSVSDTVSGVGGGKNLLDRQP
jgi:Cu2+-exporting ATPase